MSGAKQQWDPQTYDQHARFVSELAGPVLDLLAPQSGERILDLGCGDGFVTAWMADQGADVVGVDSSPDLLEAARARGLDVRLADGQNLPFDREFDAVFSNAAMHWMVDADGVIRGVARALRPGGRFVGEFGGHTNVAAIVVALLAVLSRRGIDGMKHFPWYFPSDHDYKAKLEQHGFAVSSIQLIPRPTPLPTDMKGWLETFARPFVGALPVGEQMAALGEAIDLLRPALCDSAGRWTADYVRLRFAARLIVR